MSAQWYWIFQLQARLLRILIYRHKTGRRGQSAISLNNKLGKSALYSLLFRIKTLEFFSIYLHIFKNQVISVFNMIFFFDINKITILKQNIAGRFFLISFDPHSEFRFSTVHILKQYVSYHWNIIISFHCIKHIYLQNCLFYLYYLQIANINMFYNTSPY